MSLQRTHWLLNYEKKNGCRLNINPPVCRPPQCTTTACLHLVRRPSWVQAEEHDPAGDQDDEDDRDDRDVQGIEVCRIGLMFPIYSISYILCPWISFSQVSLVSMWSIIVLVILLIIIVIYCRQWESPSWSSSATRPPTSSSSSSSSSSHRGSRTSWGE